MLKMRVLHTGRWRNWLEVTGWPGLSPRLEPRKRGDIKILIINQHWINFALCLTCKEKTSVSEVAAYLCLPERKWWMIVYMCLWSMNSQIYMPYIHTHCISVCIITHCICTCIYLPLNHKSGFSEHPCYARIPIRTGGWPNESLGLLPL